MEHLDDIQDLFLLSEDEDPNLNSAPEEQEEELTEQKLEAENIKSTIKLDYKLATIEARRDLVDRIIASTPQAQLTPRYLEILADYIMNALTKEEKKSKMYLTDNRMVTINRRETSFEGLAEKFENGEDGLYNLIKNDKNILFTQKYSITDADLARIPGLKQLKEAIDDIEQESKRAAGKRKYLLKKQLIEMRRDQYVLKNAFAQTMAPTASPAGLNKIDLDEKRYIDENGEPQSTGLISFFNEKHISAILCNYNGLKIETKGRFWDDFYYLMEAFDVLMKKALAQYPLYMDIVKLKFKGKQNIEIQKALEKKHNVWHSVEYISSLWRNKIPKLIAEKAKVDFLIWYYTYEHPEEAVWKKCSCCGQLKLAHNKFFSKNKTSKDGYYSLCKECRNAKNKKK